MNEECIFPRLHWKKKLSQFDQKSWVTGGTKIRPRIPSNWKIVESNWLDIESQIVRVNLTHFIYLRIFESNCQSQFYSFYIFENIWVKLTRYWELNCPSQFDSNILQLLGIPDRILVTPVTQFFRSKWLHILLSE